jgi:hypothetical protein
VFLTGGSRAATGSGSAYPDFSRDPHGWFDRVGRDVPPLGWRTVAESIELATWRGENGRCWRIVRASDAIEVRPGLVNPFLRYSDGPRITAIAMGDELEIELTTGSGRWLGTAQIDALDIAGLGHAMLDERELPHDNLTRLFPPPAAPG